MHNSGLSTLCLPLMVLTWEKNTRISTPAQFKCSRSWAWEPGNEASLLDYSSKRCVAINHHVQILHTLTPITYHPEKYVIVMILVLQNIKVVMDRLICCDCRTIHILSTIADFLFLCNTFVQHILSKVYLWGGNYKSKQQGLQWPWPPHFKNKLGVSELAACKSWLMRLSWSVFL